MQGNSKNCFESSLCSLIIISMHVLPEKIVGSLVGIYNQGNIEVDSPKKKHVQIPF